MKNTIIYSILLAAALLVPNEAVELGKIKPVEAVSIRIEDENIIIETDTEDVGRGATVAQAMENLKATTSGTIFLDTADYLLVEEGAERQISELSAYLKNDVRICRAAGKIDLADAAEFLNTHRPRVKLKQWQEGIKLEILKPENGRLIMK